MPAQRTPFAWRPVTLTAAVVAVLLVATVDRYGYHRDELYFRMLASHPAWGYVDQPPMTPMLVRASTWLFGDSLLGLRIPAILCAVATIVIVSLVCREFGGGRFAQAIAAIGASSTFLLLAGHLFLTASPDMVFWTLTILFAMRALDTGAPRWWVAVGVTVGISLYNKQLIVLLLLGLAGGLLIAGPREVLRSRWPWLAMLLAAAISAPTLVYQATNNWPELHMASAIARDKGPNDRVTYLPFQVILLGIGLVPVWIAGLVGLFRDPAWRRWRAVGWAYPIVSVIVLVTGGQVYYTFGLLVTYLAAGCTRLEPWVAARRGRVGWVAAALVVSILPGLVIALPVLPVRDAGPVAAINQGARDSIGWPAYVHEIAAVYATLPESDRSATAVLVDNYGEAGAIAKFGPGDGLPATVYSGLNQLYLYGPPPDTDTIAVAVGYAPADLAFAFANCAQQGTLDDNVGVDNEEQGVPVLVCRDRKAPWAALWPSLQHYG